MIDNGRLQVCPAAQDGQDRGKTLVWRRSANLFCGSRGWDHNKEVGRVSCGRGRVAGAVRASVLGHQEAQWAREAV